MCLKFQSHILKQFVAEKCYTLKLIVKYFKQNFKYLSDMAIQRSCNVFEEQYRCFLTIHK